MLCQGSSAWESTRLKTELSRVQIPPLAFYFLYKIDCEITLLVLYTETKNFNTYTTQNFSIILIKKVIKKTKPKAKKTKPKAKKTKSKTDQDNLDIIFVDEDVSIDKESELEARKAYLEEARSQESSSD